MYIRTYVHAYIPYYMDSFMYTSFTYVHIMYMYVRTYCTYMHNIIWIHLAYLYACIHDVRTYLCTYLHSVHAVLTYVHTYMAVYMYSSSTLGYGCMNNTTGYQGRRIVVYVMKYAVRTLQCLMFYMSHSEVMF